MMVRKFWTNCEDEMIRNQGDKVVVRDLAATLGRSEQAVYRRARRLKVSLVKFGEHARASKHSDCKVEQCRLMHEQGATAKVISQITGVPVGTVEGYIYYTMRVGPVIR
jgi:hypothetical protein